MNTILFDDTFTSKRTGKRIYDYDTMTLDTAQDQQLIWIHSRHGFMRLYKLLQVDTTNFIAQDMHKGCFTSSDNWDEYMHNPELALNN